MLQSRTLWI